MPGLECFPQPIMRWTERFYLEVFQRHGPFSLREHGACVMSSRSVCVRLLLFFVLFAARGDRDVF